MNEERQIGRFFIRQGLFARVKEYMGIGLGRLVSDEEAEDFLAQHPHLLGSIVGYDEVDTDDRSQIWEYCRRRSDNSLASGLDRDTVVDNCTTTLPIKF